MNKDKSKHTPKDSHYARLRRQHRDLKGGHQDSPPTRRAAPIAAINDGIIRIYGLHSVQAALQNPNRTITKMLVTKNAQNRLEFDPASVNFPVEIVTPRQIDTLVGSDSVHQGVVIETEKLKTQRLEDLGNCQLVLILDQVTDPHNVGAIMRSAVAFGAGAIITTERHSPQESGVLAKAASGALELIDMIHVRNLAEAIETLHRLGFATFGLDSEGEHPLEPTFQGNKIGLVLGAEGKGLRQKTRQTVTALARLDMPGAIKSLNVSNAAAISLYAAQQYLQKSN